MGNATDLAERRKALGLTQEQLAALLDVSQGTVSRNEGGAAPDRRYELSLDGLAHRKERGEDLAALAEAARIEAEAARAQAAA